MRIEEKAAILCAKLISRKVLAKQEVKEIFHDENIRLHVENLLKSVGLELATHIYTDYVAVKVSREMEPVVFDDGKGGLLTTNINLSRGAITLLAIIWAKLILPKRQIQIERKSPDNAQISFLKERIPIPKHDLVKLEEKTIFADFGEKLGGKTKFGTYLAELHRHGFIHKRDGVITEGPMLDTIIDYSILAPRMIEGCLAEAVGVQQAGDQEEKDV